MSHSLHVFILLDLSASMSGTGLESLKQGVQLLATALAGVGGAVRAAFIGYESNPIPLLPLTEMETDLDFNDAENLVLQTLEPAGASNLGRALHTIEGQVTPGTPTGVYIFTDGNPTDDWQPPRDALRAKGVRLVAVACGFSVNLEALRGIADSVFSVSTVTAEQLAGSLRG